jgi:hypothetical protein
MTDLTDLTGTIVLEGLYRKKKKIKVSNKVLPLSKFRTNKEKDPLSFIKSFKKLLRIHQIEKE